MFDFLASEAQKSLPINASHYVKVYKVANALCAHYMNSSVITTLNNLKYFKEKKSSYVLSKTVHFHPKPQWVVLIS